MATLILRLIPLVAMFIIFNIVLIISIHLLETGRIDTTIGMNLANVLLASFGGLSILMSMELTNIVLTGIFSLLCWSGVMIPLDIKALQDTDAYVAGYKSIKRVDRVDECKGYIRNMNAFFNFRISEEQANVRQY